MPLTIPRRRYMMGYVDRCKVKVPQLMTETDLMNPPAISFPATLKRDETWILYQNMRRKRASFKDNRPSTVAKPGLHPNKVLFVHSIGLERCSPLLLLSRKPSILQNIAIQLITEE